MGKYIVRKLYGRGADVFVADRDRYDLRHPENIRRALSDSKPHMVIHLAARVGGIGANREHPAEFFYDNLMMSVPLLHESWVAGIEKFVALGTISSCALFCGQLMTVRNRQEPWIPLPPIILMFLGSC